MTDVPAGTRLRGQPVRAALGAWAGSTIEWYDWYIYGTAAALVFGPQFFPELDSTSGVMSAFATYAAGFVARPLGGIIFGYLGDRIGRKKNLIITLLTMGTCTFLVGCLPTYREIGILAPTLLVVLRLVQGVSIGGEWGGAALMTIEHAPRSRRGFLGTLVQVGSPTAAVLSSVVFFAVALRGPDALAAWAWRVPFWLSAVLILVGLYIRSKVEESPEFVKVAASGEIVKNPLAETLRRAWRQVLLGAGIQLLGAAGIYVVSTYLLLSYTKQIGVSTAVSLLAVLVFGVACIVAMPAAGWVSEHAGRRRIAFIGAAYTLVMAYPMFWMVGTGSSVLVLLAAPICYLGAACGFALNSSMCAALFDTRIRYTGLSLSYQLAGICGGFMPLISLWLQRAAGGSVWPVPLLLMAMALISLICLGIARAAVLDERTDQGSVSVDVA